MFFILGRANCAFCAMFCRVILTCHFLILGAPAAAAEAASHFWASCLFFWGLLRLLSHTQSPVQYNKIKRWFKKQTNKINTCIHLIVNTETSHGREATWGAGRAGGCIVFLHVLLSITLRTAIWKHDVSSLQSQWGCEVNPLPKTNLFLSPSLSFNNIWGVFICQTLKCKHIESLWCDDKYAPSRLRKCFLSRKTTTLIFTRQADNLVCTFV